MSNLNSLVLEFARREGATAAGIATKATLAGGPPSVDLDYVLDGAPAGITFAVAMDEQSIPPYLMKKDRLWFEREMMRANVVASGIALHLSNYLRGKGHRAEPVAANLVYRPSGESRGTYDPTAPVYPDLAHRYLAVQAGLGHLGRSGNFIMPVHGASVILASVVTDADLKPTPPMPPEDNYCDDCGLCRAACVSGFMDFTGEERVTLGGREYTYSRRRNLARCDLVCGGYTGLARNGKWSTWSPGRFPIPEKLDDIPAAYARITNAHAQWPLPPGGRLFYYSDVVHRVACAHCQAICAPTLEERKARFRMLLESGVVVQNEDGSLESVSPAEAKKRLESMAPERRRLYEDDASASKQSQPD
jgi:epoxyqueuosine reductase QueG